MARPIASEWFFTAPMDDVPVRRGDPLGLRPVADSYGELLAPGLSNATVDGRWLCVMCWALHQSHMAREALGTVRSDGYELTKDVVNELYTWLRPLELLWVARTVAGTADRGTGRQLPGVRAVRRWLDDELANDRFGLSDDSYSSYRFTGVYGTYRVALRALPGLTKDGDGWRLDSLGRELASVVHSEVRCTRYHRGGRGVPRTPERYWMKHFAWNRKYSDFLPTELAAPRRLDSPERQLLRRALFSTTDGSEIARKQGARRKAVVEAAALSDSATRPELLADIARTLGGRKPLPELALLSPFCELADSGIAAMNACWMAVAEGSAMGFAREADVLDRQNVITALRTLATASRRWQRESTRIERHIPTADALAEGILAAQSDRRRQFLALERHHNRFGGGMKWLALDGRAIKPLAPVRGGVTGTYRFRLAAATRLGVQCGIVRSIPIALRGLEEIGEDTQEPEDTL